MTVEQLDMSSVVLLCAGLLLIGLLSYYRKVARLGARLDEKRARLEAADHTIRNLQSSVSALKTALQEANRRNQENLDYFLKDVQPEEIPPDVQKWMRRQSHPTTITTVRHV